MNEDQNTTFSEQEYVEILNEILAGFPLPPTDKPKASRSLSISAEGKPRTRSNAAETTSLKSSHQSLDFRTSGGKGDFFNNILSPQVNNKYQLDIHAISSPPSKHQQPSPDNSGSGSATPSSSSPLPSPSSSNHSSLRDDVVPIRSTSANALPPVNRKFELGSRFDEKNQNLLLSAMKGQASQKQQQDVYYMLQEFEKQDVVIALERAQKIVCEAAAQNAQKKSKFEKVVNSVKGQKTEKNPIVKLSKLMIDLSSDGQPIPVNREVIQELTIYNIGNHKAKFKFNAGAPTKRYEVSFNPKEGIIKKKLQMNVQIKIVSRSTFQINHVVLLDIEGGPRFFIVIKGESEKSVFGVDSADLESIDDFGLKIPAVLVTMKNYLYDNGALTQEGIFRLAGEEGEIVIVKDQLNRGTFCGCKDIHCVATLIKVWYRELPNQVFNSITKQTLLQECEEQADCVRLFKQLPEPSKSLAQWLLELLADVAARENENKMSPKNLAIILAPNLYSNKDADPSESLVLSQKVVNFVYHLIIYFMQERYES